MQDKIPLPIISDDQFSNSEDYYYFFDLFFHETVILSSLLISVLLMKVFFIKKVDKKPIFIFFIINFLLLFFSEVAHYFHSGSLIIEPVYNIWLVTALTFLFVLIYQLSHIGIRKKRISPENLIFIFCIVTGSIIFFSNLKPFEEEGFRFVLDTDNISFNIFTLFYYQGPFSLHFYEGHYDCGVVFSPTSKWTFFAINIFGSSVYFYLLAKITTYLASRCNFSKST